MLRLFFSVLAAITLARPLAGQIGVEVNRPRSEFQCDTPIGIEWYGSEERCLQELCGGKNVFNEYIFDEHNRRRRNPCYGQNPTQFER